MLRGCPKSCRFVSSANSLQFPNPYFWAVLSSLNLWDPPIHPTTGKVVYRPAAAALKSHSPPGNASVPHIDVRQATDEHFARIHRAALVLSGNPWDADDLAQETFLVLARQSSQFSG